MSPRRIVAACLISALLLASPLAAAATGFEEALDGAKSELKAGQLEAALKAFKHADALATEDAQRWRAWLGQAVTYEEMKRLAPALRAYKRFLSGTTTTTDARWQQQRREVAAEVAKLERLGLATKLAILRVESATPAAIVTVYGPSEGASSEPPAAPAHFYLQPGNYRLRVEAKGYVARDMAVGVKLGERKTVVVDLTPSSAVVPKPPKKPQKPTKTPPDTSGVWDLRVGATAVTAGILLASAVTLHVAAFFDAEEANGIYDAGSVTTAGNERIRFLERRGTDRQLAAQVLYGVAGAAAVTSLVLALLRPAGDSANGSVSVGFGPSGASLGFGGAF